MKVAKTKNYLGNYIAEVQADGKLYFTLNDIKNNYNINYETAIKFSLNNLFKKGKIVSVYKGFYVIIPPEYRKRKMIPPELFIDALFAYLKRSYYMGLLSAAALHGASHQQVMEYYVFIDKPAMRPINIEGLKINYVVKKVMPDNGIIKRKTDAGYINVSSAELTAFDLVEYQHRIGGLNRATTVLYELTDAISSVKLGEVLNENIPISVLQRLGFIFEMVLNQNEMAEVIKSYLSDKKVFRIPLKPGYKKKGFDINNDWKVIQNFEIETDF